MARKPKRPIRQVSTPKKAPQLVWVPAFLAAFRETGNVRLAVEAAGVDRSTPYAHRQADPAFAAAWDAAKEDAADGLVAEARRRAVEGVRRLKFHQGVPVMVPLLDADGRPRLDATGEPVLTPYVEHEYSDTLLIFLTKAARPEEYRERHEVDHKGIPAPPPALDLSKLTDAQLRQLDAALAPAVPATGGPGPAA